MPAFYRAALLHLGLFVLVLTVIVTASKGSLSIHALALPVAFALLTFFLQRRSLARSWAATGWDEWLGTAARLTWRNRWELCRATVRGRAVADPRLSALAVQRADHVRALLEGGQKPEGDGSWYPFSVGAAVAWAGLALLEDWRWGWALVSFAAAPVIAFLIPPLINPQRVRRAQRCTQANHGPASLE